MFGSPLSQSNERHIGHVRRPKLVNTADIRAIRHLILCNRREPDPRIATCSPAFAPQRKRSLRAKKKAQRLGMFPLVVITRSPRRPRDLLFFFRSAGSQ